MGTASVLWSTDAFLSKNRLKVKSTRRANDHVQQCTRSAMHATRNAHDDKSARRAMHTTIRKRTRRATHALSKAHDAQRTRRAMHTKRNGHDETNHVHNEKCTRWSIHTRQTVEKYQGSINSIDQTWHDNFQTPSKSPRLQRNHINFAFSFQWITLSYQHRKRPTSKSYQLWINLPITSTSIFHWIICFFLQRITPTSLN